MFCLSHRIIIQCSSLDCKECWLSYTYYFCRLQLMIYKFLLDSLISDGFSSRQFFDFFSLNPHSTLSEEISDSTTPLGFTAKVELLNSACFSAKIVIIIIMKQMILTYILKIGKKKKIDYLTKYLHKLEFVSKLSTW